MLEFRDVSFGYAGHTVLQGVTLELEAGGFYFLTGPSGAGKTTFLRLCTLEARPQEGQMQVFGEDPTALSRDQIAALRRRMGTVHQDCQFLDHLSVRRNLSFPLEIAGRHRPENAKDIEEVLSWIDLADRADARPPELSGGERQRAALARAVILSPEILIADEPTGNIDREMGYRIIRLLAELNRLGRTVLVATHDLDLIRAAKAEGPARVLRLSGGTVHRAEVEL
ncbi:MAG: ATP-binding cassette domain-containing protein [Pseudomonadota bacterium]